MSDVLEIKNISKTFGKRKVLDGITFSVGEGEILGFLGPNGSGKTTTIKMILGLLGIDEGEILICSHNVEKDFEKAIANVGGIIENPEMYKMLTGRENLMQYARMYGGISKEKIEEVIKTVGLADRIDEKISKYSLGMRQRLGIAQAILHEPKLLVLDEPTNGLDPDGIKQLRLLFRSLSREKGTSVLVSSHMLAELDLMCDRIAIIDGGKITDIKTITEIRSVSEDDSIEYEIECAAENGAENFFKSKDIPFTVHENGRYAISYKKSAVPSLVKEMADSSISIYAVIPRQKTLEDAYLESTAHSGKGGGRA